MHCLEPMTLALTLTLASMLCPGLMNRPSGVLRSIPPGATVSISTRRPGS